MTNAINIAKYIDVIEFDERYESELYNTTTLYFVGPKEILSDKYPECESVEISIEFPSDEPDCLCPAVCISPTKDGSDYDWTCLYIPKEVFDELISKSALPKGEKDDQT